MSYLATCTRCGATKLTEKLAKQLGGKAACVACLSECRVEPEAPSLHVIACPLCSGQGGSSKYVSVRGMVPSLVQAPCEGCKGQRVVAVEVEGPLEVLKQFQSEESKEGQA